jgi:Delta7-sterol 5-desaturase
VQKLLNSLTHIDPITLWIWAFVVGGLIAGVLSGYLGARKIQPNGFKWKFFRREIMWAVVSVTFSGVVLGFTSKWLVTSGFIRIDPTPAPLWVIATQYVLYFITFDTWFYWLHRAMHTEPLYSLIHKVHHGSLSPNPLTTLSVNPLESFINGGWVPIFAVLMTQLWPIHSAAFALITPTNIVMGFYVHLGFEFLPSWWNKSWLTKWFISSTFHDQHHRFFKGNYGGYTTVWDRLCGTVRPTFEADFEKVTTRPIKPVFGARTKPSEEVLSG